ncbi:hypothetical protein [Clostridium chauvoei]|uniref:Uncharacterized protein n=2 Tax=Clostridium chauvoei TaxID=46867 RepID=S6EIU9_9CLOT|nr:hypothetical protein [Clostridium chauvoei]ATD54520.1 hypothetical protein BTM20_04440 [Clostridium chauvoei]ATD57798.1 hypothetical protein BTM21_08620 [Clostridium chauvoei]MBX7281071.1 NAD-dependent dehydratase [Clostridium chauvoei]MBX7283542.1 NAD-dependent dehydratase [Clostridium chauvoei]MBX7286044.1 NAD-dependent dehydratase [Clostridium chauvoei]
MRKRIVLIGAIDEFMVYFSKYLILNNTELYIVIRKEQTKKVLDELGNNVSVIRYDGNTEHLKLFFKSIDADIVYNLSYFCEDRENIKDFIDKNYTFITDILEGLKVSKKTRFINLREKYELDENNMPIDIHSAILKSMDLIRKYYIKKCGLNIIDIEKCGDPKVDIENILNLT